MNYSNKICPVCGKAFCDGDDIVVCPECATPHHRACWAENGKCANGELHESGYVWGKEKTAAPAEKAEETQNDDVKICHICGSENPADILHCGNCGALFGEQNQPDESEKKCQFCGKINPDDALHCNQCGAPLGTGASSTAFFGDTPYIAGTDIPADEKIGDITAGDFAIYTRASAGRYIKKFRKFANGKKLSFNFAAFFFSPGWFFYRKIYKAGIFFLVAFVTLAILTSNQTAKLDNALLKYSEPIEQSYSEYYELSISENVTEEQLLEKTEEITKLVTGYFRETWTAYLTVYGTNFILCLICALIADKLYYNKAVEDLKEINENHLDSPVKRMIISRKGGLSALGFIFCSIAQGMLINTLYTAAELIKGLF